MCRQKKFSANFDVLCESQELKRFPSLQSDIAASANNSLERFRDDSRKTVLRLVEMESTYLTVEFFRKLQLEPEKNTGNQPASNSDRYTDNHLKRIGKLIYTLSADAHMWGYRLLCGDVVFRLIHIILSWASFLTTIMLKLDNSFAFLPRIKCLSLCRYGL